MPRVGPCKRQCLFFEATARGGQIGGVDERGGVLPKGCGLDQRLEDHIVDLPQSHYAQMEAKGVQDAGVGHAMAMAEPGKAAPGALLGQHRREQIKRMHGRQQRQQMHTPELCRAELPAWTTHWPGAPMLVDEIVGNVWIQNVEQTTGAGWGKAFHAGESYPFGNAASGFC